MASWQEFISVLWTRLSDPGATRHSGTDVHDTGKFSPCSPLEEEPDMKNLTVGFVNDTMILDRNEQSGSFGGRQAQVKTTATSESEDMKIPDGLIRDAGLHMIELGFTGRYEDEPDYFGQLVIGAQKDGTKG
jgi:hypothetical protein